MRPCRRAMPSSVPSFVHSLTAFVQLMCECHLRPRRVNPQRLEKAGPTASHWPALSACTWQAGVSIVDCAALTPTSAPSLRSSEPLALPAAVLASHGLSQGGPLASPRGQPHARGESRAGKRPHGCGQQRAAGSGEPVGPAALAEAWSWASTRDRALSPGRARPGQQGLSSARLPLRKAVGLRLSDLST